MSLSNFFAKITRLLALQENAPDLAQVAHMDSRLFHDRIPDQEGRREYTCAFAVKNKDGTWNVTTAKDRIKDRDDLDYGLNCPADGDLAKNVTIDNAIAALELFEKIKFESGMDTDISPYAAQGHFSLFKSAGQEKKRRGPGL